jgi:uncharacterized protein
MRSRALSWEMFPFSFYEFLDCRNIVVKDRLSSKDQLLIRKALDDYWEQGGFPEVTHLDKHLRIKIHQEYFHSILYRDLIERHDVARPKAVTDLAHWLVDNTASLYSINRLTNYLKSLGHKLTKSSVSEYLQWFEDAYFLFSVNIHDASVSRRNANPKKIYCIDHSLVTSVSSGILLNTGHLLENLVFVAIRRKYSEIFYYKTKNGLEVDFVVLKKGHPKILIQVSETIKEEKTYRREINALQVAMAEQNLKDGVLVTRNETETIKTDSGTIHVIAL